MATSYSTLKTEIAAYTHRGDLTSYLDTFIDNTEAKMNRKLRMSEQETSTSIAVTTSDVTLPTDFLEVQEIHVSSSPDAVLEYLTPFQYKSKDSTETGTPRFYTVMDDTIKVYPVSSCTVVLHYYKSITALDDTNTTNFVITRFPELYLHGTLYEAGLYMQDANMAALHGQEFNRVADEANRASRKRKTSGTPLQVRVA